LLRPRGSLDVRDPLLEPLGALLGRRCGEPPERFAGGLAHDAVDGQLMLALEVPHRCLGQRPKEPVDWSGVLARSAQPPLEGPDALGTPRLAITGSRANHRRRAPERGCGHRPDHPVYSEALARLELAHRGFRERSKEGVDRSWVLARPAQPSLDRSHAR
jgi:hypothetical protein